MKYRKNVCKKIILVLFALLILFALLALILFWKSIRTAASVRQIEDGLYSMEYKGDYKLDEFLESGDASTDLAVADFVIGDIFHGMMDLHLQGYGFGCSTIAAESENGDRLFGRNFDWGTCTTMIVETHPAEGYASVSTVNMDFLDIGLNSLPEGMRIKILASAAPYAPMDGMNEKGLCVAVLMIDDRPGFEQDTGKPDLTTTTAVRVLLDKAADVDEAVALLRAYDLHASMGMMVHFALADTSGHSVIVEYVDNELSVVDTAVATNFYLTKGEKYGIGTEESHTRYEILNTLLAEQDTLNMDQIRDALDSVSKHNFDSPFASTEWSIVYNQSTGEIRYYHRENFEKASVFQLY